MDVHPTKNGINRYWPKSNIIWQQKLWEKPRHPWSYWTPLRWAASFAPGLQHGQQHLLGIVGIFHPKWGYVISKDGNIMGISWKCQCFFWYNWANWNITSYLWLCARKKTSHSDWSQTRDGEPAIETANQDTKAMLLCLRQVILQCDHALSHQPLYESVRA